MLVIGMLAVLFIGVVIAQEIVNEEAKDSTDFRYDTHNAICIIRAQNEKRELQDKRRQAAVRGFFKVPPFNN